MDSPNSYERIEHTADLAIRVWGPDLPALFINAASALFEMMSRPPLEDDLAREVVVEAPDSEALFVDWLNHLIYLHEVEHETYTRFAIVELTIDTLRAMVYGGKTLQKTKTIKAATYHDLAFHQTADGYETVVVFDV